MPLSPFSGPHPSPSSASVGPTFSRAKARRGYSGLITQILYPLPPFLWLDQTCPIPSLLKGPTRIVALLRKRKFFS